MSGDTLRKIEIRIGQSLAEAIAWDADGRGGRAHEREQRIATLDEVRDWLARHPGRHTWTAKRSLLDDWKAKRWEQLPTDGYCPGNPAKGHAHAMSDYGNWGPDESQGHPYCGACGYIDKARTL